MELYFAEGADLTDREVLVQAAADCGMDADLTRELLASDRDVDRVTAEATQAKEAGIDGVPCFILGGVLAVSGAQDPVYLADAMARALREVASALRHRPRRNKLYRANRSASTRIALAVIQEPTTRTPM